MKLNRLAPLSGIAAIASVIVGLALDNFPGRGSTDAQVVQWFAVHGTLRWIVSGACIALGGTLLLVFSAVLTTRVEQSGAGPVVSRLVHTACTAWAVLTMAGGALWLSVPVSLLMLDAQPSASMLDVSGPSYTILVSVCAFAAAVTALALSAASWRTGLLPRWLATTGFPVGVLMLANTLLPMAVITLFYTVVAIALTVRRPIYGPSRSSIAPTSRTVSSPTAGDGRTPA